jgi:hypothetical protein
MIESTQRTRLRRMSSKLEQQDGGMRVVDQCFWKG